MKKILALILAATLLVFIVACDDEDEYVGGDNEIDVSIGGFFDDVEDTNDSDDTTENAADTAEGTVDDTAESDTNTADTEAAE